LRLIHLPERLHWAEAGVLRTNLALLGGHGLESLLTGSIQEVEGRLLLENGGIHMKLNDVRIHGWGTGSCVANGGLGRLGRATAKNVLLNPEGGCESSLAGKEAEEDAGEHEGGSWKAEAEAEVALLLGS
jgi:hypothetical protein